MRNEMSVNEALDIAECAIWDKMNQIDPDRRGWDNPEMDELNEALLVLNRLRRGEIK